MSFMLTGNVSDQLVYIVELALTPCSCRFTSHRIVRLLDRTIGCDLANVRPIGNVCYDLQKLSHTAIGLFCWW